MSTKSWPARSIAECNKILTSPGSFWETSYGVVDGRLMTYYKTTPGPTMREFWLASKVHGDKDYIVYLEERFTYNQSHVIVARTANILQQEYGLVKGDRVALLARNSPEWIFIFWACHLLGCAPVAINSWVSPEQMAHCISNSGARLLAVDYDRLAELQPYLEKLPELGGVLLLKHQGDTGVRIPPWFRTKRWEVLDKLYAKKMDVPDAEIHQDDLCAIYYTSGTTGMPKGVPSTSRMFMTGLMNMMVPAVRSALRRGEDMPKPQPGSQKSMLMPAPLFHVTGSSNLLPLTTFLGAKFVMMYKWDVEKALAIINKEEITHSGGVPFVLRSLLDAGLSSSGSALESISYGGAPSGPTLIQDCAKAFPNASFSQAYGMTENYTIAASQCEEDFLWKPSSTGVATPVCKILIMDPQGQQLPSGHIGEIWLRSPSTAHGYWRMPEATKASFTPDGWFKTGDLGYLDQEMFLFIADRLKDIIIRGGENIPSIDVENGLLKDSRISEVCCVSIPHPALSEEVAVVVVPKPGVSVTEESVHAFAATVLKRMWRPRLVIIQTGEVIKNANGKHDKKIVRTEVRSEWAERQKSAPRL